MLFAMSDDLSYGLNTLGPLCLWQCLYSYFILNKNIFFLASDFLASDSIAVAIVFYLILKTSNIGFNCCVRLSLSSKFMSQLCSFTLPEVYLIHTELGCAEAKDDGIVNSDCKKFQFL